MPGHQLGALAEGAVADDGIERVVVHVKHRGKVHVDADASALACHLATIFIEQLVIVDGPQYQVTLEVGYLLEAHAQSPLTVDGDHQGHCRQRLGQVGDLGLLGDGAVLIDESAHQVPGDEATHQFARGIVAPGSDSRDNELADACVGRERIEHAVHPLVHRHLVHVVEQVGHPDCARTAGRSTQREHCCHCHQ